MSIFILLAVLSVGILLGLLLRKIGTLVTINRQLTRVSLLALLTVMGGKLAWHREIFTEDLSIFFIAIGSSVVLTLVFFLVFGLAGLARKHGSKLGAAIDLPKATPVAASSGGGRRELLSAAINGGCILAGFLLFWLLPETYARQVPIDAFSEWALRALLFFVGFDLGVELNRLDLRGLTSKVLLVPFINIAMSLAIGMSFGLLSGLGAREGSLLTAGMGWYSLSSVLLADRGMITLSILSFIHNVLRELLAIFCAPLAAKVSPILPVYLGGATSMDVMLPFVQRYCGTECTLVSFYSGVICSIAVMPLVKIIAG